MALIATTVYNTTENNRTWMLDATLESIRKTVDFGRHRLFAVDNGSESATETEAIYAKYEQLMPLTVIRNGSNLGTAKAINKAWLHRRSQEHAVKIDSDMVVNDAGWVDKLEMCVDRDPTIGVCGLKRKDCIEAPWVEGWYRSELRMLPHQPGEPWAVVEDVSHVIGSCALHSWRLLEKIGFLWQSSFRWGFDDSLMAARCKHAGFRCSFYPHIDCDHVDPGDRDYHRSKGEDASRNFPVYNRILAEYANGTRSLYNGPEDD